MMHTTPEPHTREEVANLLEQQRQEADVPHPTPRRRQVLRTLVGIVATATLVAGAVVAVEVTVNSSDAASSAASVNAIAAPHVMALNTREGGGVQPSAFEARFGWGSFKSGWCSIRANAGCLFSGDREKCKKEIHDVCDSKEEAAPASHRHGSGSGSGSGWDSDDGSGSGSGHAHHKRELRSGFPEAGIPM